MKVRYTEFCLNPTLRGTTAHLPQHRAVALIDNGAAVEVPMPARGTPGWLEYRKAESEASAATVEPAVVTWHVGKAPISERIFISAKCSRSNCSSFFFDGDERFITVHGHLVGLEGYRFTHSCGDSTGPLAIPADILARYHAAKKTENPKITASEGDYYRASQPNPTDGKPFSAKQLAASGIIKTWK